MKKKENIFHTAIENIKNHIILNWTLWCCFMSATNPDKITHKTKLQSVCHFSAIASKLKFLITAVTPDIFSHSRKITLNYDFSLKKITKILV